MEDQQQEAGRRYGEPGNQLVEVSGGYAYRWTGDEPLKVGNRVMLPPNWLSEIKHGPGPFEGVVTALGVTYEGPLSEVVGRAEEAKADGPQPGNIDTPT